MTPTRPSDKDAGCAYNEIAHYGFWWKRVLDYRIARDSVRYRGVGGTLRKFGERIGVVKRGSTDATRNAVVRFTPEEEVLGLQPGEWVEVKSAEEIRATLDHRGMVRGLYFMDEMWKFEGQRFRVLKRMERLMVDRIGHMRHIKTTVRLEGTVCDGGSHEGCDALCHHLWREVWLRRVDGPGPDAGADTASG